MPCKVNGLALKSIFDTEVIDLSISTEALFMLKMDTWQRDLFGK